MRLSFSIAILAAAVFVTAQTNDTETEEPNREATGNTKCARVFDKCYRTTSKAKCEGSNFYCFCGRVAFEEFMTEASDCAFNECAVNLTYEKYKEEQQTFRVEWLKYCEYATGTTLPFIPPPPNLPIPDSARTSTSSTSPSSEPTNSPVNSDTPSTSETPAPPSPQGLNTPDISHKNKSAMHLGIGLGVALGALFLLVGVFAYLFFRRKNQKEEALRRDSELDAEGTMRPPMVELSDDQVYGPGMVLPAAAGYGTMGALQGYPQYHEMDSTSTVRPWEIDGDEILAIKAGEMGLGESHAVYEIMGKRMVIPSL